MHINFRTWLEYSDIGTDIFGFDAMKDHIDKNPGDQDQDDMPIKPFGVQRLLERLGGKRLSGVNAKMPFNDTVSWGSKPGAVRVKLTPNGNVMIERKVQDLDGNEVWYVNKVFKINTEHFAGYEDAVADEIFDRVTKVYGDKVDSPSREYGELRNLAKQMAARLRQVVGDAFLFHDIKEVNENEYILVFDIAATGVGLLVSKKPGGQAPEVNVNVSFNENTGMIRCIFNTVSAEAEGQGWEIDVPYFDGLFSPAQDPHKIIDAVATTLKFF